MKKFGILKIIFLVAIGMAAFHLNIAHASDPFIGYWKFDEGSGTSALDSDGGSDTGTINGATYSTDVPSTGFSDPYSLSFSGSDNVDVPYDAYFDLGSVFTLDAWTKVNSFDSQYSFLISRDGDAGASYDFGFKNNNPYVAINDGTGWAEYVATGYSFPTDSWHRITATRYSDNSLEIFVDGSPVATFTNTKIPQGVMNLDLTFGKRSQSSGDSYLYNGLIDDVRIYNAPLYSEVTSDSVDSITQTTAVFHGTLNSGINPVETLGFQYATDPSYSDAQTVFESDGPYNSGTYLIPVSGLTCGTTYDWKSYATDNSPNIQSGSNETFTTSPCGPVPDQITDLTATAVSSSEIDLSWTEPNGNGSTINGYEIDRQAPGGSFVEIQTPPDGITSVPDLTGLEPGTQYQYRIFAISEAGSADPSNVATATTLSPATLAPVTPIGSTTTIQNAIYTFSNNQSDGEYEFTPIQEHGVNGQVEVYMNPTTHQVTFSGLQVGGTYSTSFQFTSSGGVSNTLNVGPFTVVNQLAIGPTISGGEPYGCTDPTATNYDHYAISKPSLCSYATKTVSSANIEPSKNLRDIPVQNLYHFTRVLKFGMKGDDVAALQNFLKIPVTKYKYFGLKTKVALMDYQKTHHLMPDGVFGPATVMTVSKNQ